MCLFSQYIFLIDRWQFQITTIKYSCTTPMAMRSFSRAKLPSFLVSLLGRDLSRISIYKSSACTTSQYPILEYSWFRPIPDFRLYHDGRPRGPLWRGKKLIGKEAIFVILGLKRFKDDEEKLDKFIKCHVLRLLKMEMVAVLTELERQEEVTLAVKVFSCFLF